MNHMYEERTPKAWTIACVTVYVVGVAWMGATSLPEDFGAWLAVSGLFLLGLIACLGVPISKFLYNRIQLTPDTLRVGRERIPVADLDPESVRAALDGGQAGVVERLATSMSRNDIPVRGLRAADHGGPRIVGGAWGVPMGMDSVIIATRSGEALCIATRNRTAFLTALLQASSRSSTSGPGAPVAG